MTIYILPGMGADSSMYGETFRKLDGVRYVDWPHANNEQTISQIAKRIIKENNIQVNDTVGGSSLGGIVAAEISKYISLNKLILIGSTLTPDNINPILKKLSTLSAITPVTLIQTFAGKINSLQESRLLKMFSQAESSFIRSMCKAVVEWEGNPDPDCPIAHIHGAKDKVILPPRTGAKILEDGGHLIAMTHEQCVVDFIKSKLGSDHAN